MGKLLSMLAAGTALTMASAAADAANVTFTATGAFDATWTLPQSPTPDADLGTAFRLDDVDIVFNGAPTTALIEFYSAGGGGGACSGFACTLFDLYGPALFTGSTAAPTFTLGTFNMTQGVLGPAVTLTIANAIPEPESWALMIGGFAMAGAAMRRRATKIAYA